ncbi:MAG: hypothetical protein ACE5HT_09290 [Gemmatimonadales bacterium]
METVTVLATMLAVIAVFVLLSLVIAQIDGLAFLAPKSSKRIAASAGTFCVNQCQRADGQCPLVEVGRNRAECPLWQFVEADLPTVMYGDPFAYLHKVATQS